MSQRPMMQQLESRTLLHGLPSIGGMAQQFGRWVGPVIDMYHDATVQAALDAVRANMKTLRVDQRAANSALQADRKAISEEIQKMLGDEANKTAMQPLYDKFAADRKAGAATLRADRKAILDKKAEFKDILKADRKAIRAARGDEAKMDAAQAQLEADLKKVADAVKPLYDQLAADKKALDATLKADRDAIIAKLKELDPALQPLYDKLEADIKTWTDTLTADRNTLHESRLKLQEAIDAWKAANPVEPELPIA